MKKFLVEEPIKLRINTEGRTTDQTREDFRF